MEKYKLSQCYALASERAAEAITEFYEQIHDIFGDPIDDIEHIDMSMRTIKKIIASELDLIKQSCIEYNEIRQKDQGGSGKNE